jgi:CheY-like chemotaxis protein
VASLSSRQAIGPSFLPRSERGEFDLVLLDLDLDPQTAPAELCAQVAAVCRDTPIVALAGVDARQRLMQALAHDAVVSLVPKAGATLLAAVAADAAPIAIDGPDEQALGLALRRRVEPSAQPIGPAPYLLGGTDVEERIIGGSVDKDAALQALLADAARFGFSDEKMRRIETVADELVINAVYEAPRDDAGRVLHAHADRRATVVLAAQAQVRLRWGCDGRTFAISVADRFGALDRAVIVAHVGKLLDARAARHTHAAGAGQSKSSGRGLALVFGAGNELALHVAAGRFTEATCALHVGGSNRAALGRGSALHLYMS